MISIFDKKFNDVPSFYVKVKREDNNFKYFGAWETYNEALDFIRKYYFENVKQNIADFVTICLAFDDPGTEVIDIMTIKLTDDSTDLTEEEIREIRKNRAEERCRLRQFEAALKDINEIKELLPRIRQLKREGIDINDL